MLNGNDLWGSRITSGMQLVTAHGRELMVYADAPASPYTSLSATAERSPMTISLVSESGHELTFSQLLVLVDQLATLLEDNISPGDRVALLLDTSIEFAVAAYAVNRCGGVLVPIPTKHREPEMRSLLSNAAPKLVLAERRFEAQLSLRELRTEFWWVEDRDEGYGFRNLDIHRLPSRTGGSIDPDADCILMYTSGTTAASKGVLLTNRNVGHAVAVYQRVLGIQGTDSAVLAIPIYYVTGIVALLGLFVHVGGRLHLHRRFDADKVLQTVHDHSITFLHASPTVFALLLEASIRFPYLPSLRMMACGAAHMPISRIRALHSWLPWAEFRTIYGLTETTSPAIIFPGDAATSVHIGSSGIPIPGLQLSIRDDEGDEVSQGEHGSIWLHGTNLLRRYDEIEPCTLTPQGWLDTGDVGYINEDGYLFVVDRVKDMINRGGEKVWCIDVEEALRQLPGVADAAVAGIPDDKYGEIPAALVVPKPGHHLTAEEITLLLSERLARYAIPVKFLFQESMPLTPNMKVDKRLIRKLLSPPESSPAG